MLSCEGYKMFYGKVRIVPKSSITTFEVEGVWLYKPEYNCWYCNGRSYPAEICEILEDTTKIDEKKGD